MATSYKKLGSTTVVADTDTSLYTVPASTETIVSSIAVCNRGTSAATFRIAHVDGAIGTVGNDDYIYYDVTLNGNDTFVATIGFAMIAANSILVRSNSANVNFIAWGSEIS